jgi:hypothetical protein
MMTLNQAIAYGRHIGVKYYIKTESGKIYGGAKTKEKAEAMKRELEREWKPTKFVIEEVS